MTNEQYNEGSIECITNQLTDQIAGLETSNREYGSQEPEASNTSTRQGMSRGKKVGIGLSAVLAGAMAVGLTLGGIKAYKTSKQIQALPLVIFDDMVNGESKYKDK